MGHLSDLLSPTMVQSRDNYCDYLHFQGESRRPERLGNFPNCAYLGADGARIPRQVCLPWAILWLLSKCSHCP